MTSASSALSAPLRENKVVWQTKRIGDLCDVVNGGTPKTGVPEYWDGSNLWITPAEMGKRLNPYVSDTERKISDLGLRESSARTLPPNSVILSSRAPIGHLVINTEPMATNQGCKGLVPSSQLQHKFLYYYLSSIVDLLNSLGTGATFKELSGGKLKEVTVPLPPLPEQLRIVGLLDEAFAGLDTAKANARKNLQNAGALFESYLQSVFDRRGAEWERVTLETLLERGWIEGHLDGNHGSDYPRKEEFISEGVPYISANCLDDERVDMSRAKYLSPNRAALLRKGIAKDNDVLFAHNATVGPVAILHTDEEKVILGTSLTYYRCNPRHILAEYLAHYMRSFGFKSQYLQMMRQSTRNQVPITKQREFYHIIPPLDEQKRIIGALDGLFENGQRLATIYERKLTALDALKKSLLHQAFSGNL
jgi:type I restriction enzyme S subunit